MDNRVYEGMRLGGGALTVDKDILDTGGTIHYKSGDIDVYQQYHPFWLVKNTSKVTESYRMTILDFSKDENA